MAKPKNQAGYDGAAGLTLSLMTLRYASLPERIEAASAAGFKGIGWRLEDFATPPPGFTEASLVQLAAASPVRLLELEFLHEWVGRENDPGYCEREGRSFALADQFGAKRMNVAVFTPATEEDIVASLRALCQRAAAHNLTVQLEFMPYTPPVDSLSAAWKIVQAVGEPNAALLIDAWHWARARESAGSLEPVPPERITAVQLSGVLARPLPDVVQESRHYRCLPGAGAFNLPLFLQILARHGVQAALSVEVMSDQLDALPPTQVALEVADGARSVLRDATSQMSAADVKRS
jgi:sugar phosphate isomerase/epimerase